MKFSERMYPRDNMKEVLQIDEDAYEVELRPPKWEEVIRAEARATCMLKDVIKNPVDSRGMPLPLPAHERRVLNLQTGIELAKACVVSVGGTTTAEEGFWDRLPAPIITALGGMLMELLYDTEVGRKNSMPQQEPRRTLRKLRKPAPAVSSPTPSSEGSTSSVSFSGTDTDTPTSVKCQ